MDMRGGGLVGTGSVKRLRSEETRRSLERRGVKAFALAMANSCDLLLYIRHGLFLLMSEARWLSG